MTNETTNSVKDIIRFFCNKRKRYVSVDQVVIDGDHVDIVCGECGFIVSTIEVDNGRKTTRD